MPVTTPDTHLTMNACFCPAQSITVFRAPLDPGPLVASPIVSCCPPDSTVGWLSALLTPSLISEELLIGLLLAGTSSWATTPSHNSSRSFAADGIT